MASSATGSAERRSFGHRFQAIIDEAWRRARRRRFALLVVAGLLLATTAVLILRSEPPAGSRDGATGAARPNQGPASLDLTKCSPNRHGAASASGWGGSVAGLGCVEAGSLILQDFIPKFVEGPLAAANWNTYESLQRSAPKPSEYQAAGFVCSYGSYKTPGPSGWHILCTSKDGTKQVDWTFSP